MLNKTITTALLLIGALSIFSLPAYADQSVEPIDWHKLPAETRETLAPMADRWKKLKPHQQHKLVRRASDEGFKNRAERWQKLSPEERKRIVKARKRFKDMPPEKRKELRKRWENMSDKERREIKDKARKHKERKDKAREDKSEKKDK
jgi:predicted Fe-S protein YdhL (DUF1289 family)